MKHLIIFLITIVGSFNALSQNLSFSVGTDIPYQHYIGINFETKKIDMSYRTGILIPPYSDAILDIIQNLGTDEIYINLLDTSFDFGWMNNIGTYYKFGKQKNWYIGSELRFDNLTVADTPKDLIEALTGQSVNTVNLIDKNIELKLGLRMIAVGLRFGKSFSISSNNKHHIKTEFSINKYITTQSVLKVNGKNFERINQELDRLLWEDVFRPYGYVGGIGFAYCYKF